MRYWSFWSCITRSFWSCITRSFWSCIPNNFKNWITRSFWSCISSSIWNISILFETYLPIYLVIIQVSTNHGWNYQIVFSILRSKFYGLLEDDLFSCFICFSLFKSFNYLSSEMNAGSSATSATTSRSGRRFTSARAPASRPTTSTRTRNPSLPGKGWLVWCFGIRMLSF